MHYRFYWQHSIFRIRMSDDLFGVGQLTGLPFVGQTIITTRAMQAAAARAAM